MKYLNSCIKKFSISFRFVTGSIEAPPQIMNYIWTEDAFRFHVRTFDSKEYLQTRGEDSAGTSSESKASIHRRRTFQFIRWNDERFRHSRVTFTDCPPKLKLTLRRDFSVSTGTLKKHLQIHLGLMWAGPTTWRSRVGGVTPMGGARLWEKILQSITTNTDVTVIVLISGNLHERGSAVLLLLTTSTRFFH